MNKEEKSYFLVRVRGLQPKEQLELCKIFLEELSLNNGLIKNYNSLNLSNSLIATLKDFIARLGQGIEEEKAVSLLNKFQELDEKHQKAVITKLIPIIEDVAKQQQKEDAEKICLKEGHTFSNWEHIKFTTFETDYIDHELVPNIEVLHESWKRVCARCGFTENVKKKPQEIIEKESKKERQDKIRRLKKELQKLESEEN